MIGRKPWPCRRQRRWLDGRYQHHEPLPARCTWCGSPAPAGKLFCSADCRQAWQMMREVRGQRRL